MRHKIYRWFMELAHRHGWHKMDESHPEGDTLLWCHWCGLRVVTKRAPDLAEAGGKDGPVHIQRVHGNSFRIIDPPSG